jgi:hypothetical protein
MADLYSTLGSNALKTLGDGAAGIGPYTRFGTPQLTAIQVTSTAVNESTTPAIQNSNLSKIVRGVALFAEIYYVGKPDGTNGTVFLVAANTLNRGANEDFEEMEDAIRAITGQAEDDNVVTEVTLTGLTFA